MTLRQRLIDAKLAGTHRDDSQVWQYTFRSNEAASGEALAVVVAFLREQAEELRQLARDAEDRYQDGDPNAEAHRERFRCEYGRLRRLADSIERGDL
jgi:hypothetical protein